MNIDPRNTGQRVNSTPVISRNGVQQIPGADNNRNGRVSNVRTQALPTKVVEVRAVPVRSNTIVHHTPGRNQMPNLVPQRHVAPRNGNPQQNTPLSQQNGNPLRNIQPQRYVDTGNTNPRGNVPLSQQDVRRR